jgi:arginyl-tRNA synthetase
MTPAADLRFGDYQSNSAMVLAKKQKTNPRALAEQIMAAVEIDGLATAKIDGPGFLNFTILPEAYAAHAESLLGDPRLGAPEPGKGKTVVVDFSGPNVAKPMHVGHIRSTIIGDSLCRIARFLGFKVIADNHIGDWGTQFGSITPRLKLIPFPNSSVCIVVSTPPRKTIPPCLKPAKPSS